MEMTRKNTVVVANLGIREKITEYLCYIGRNIAPSTFLLTGSRIVK